MSKGNILKKASLADLIFRAIFVIFSILTVGITIHTYQLSINTINEEVKRNLQQTSSLITNYFNHRLAILQIRQDTDAGSLGLTESNNKDLITGLEHYFSGIEAKSPDNSPDFRFIEVENKLYWEDGNNLFLGMTDDCLQGVIEKNIHINTWYYMSIDNSEPQAHLLIRKTPVVSSFTGKVRGYLYNAEMLNNNISFAHDIKAVSNSQDVFILSNKNIIASSIKKDSEEYRNVEQLISESKVNLPNSKLRAPNKILNFTYVDIKSLNGSLSILSLNNKNNIEQLEQRFIYSVVLSFFALIAMAILIRGLFEHKILLALNTLLNYTNNASKKDVNIHYLGSGILEFDHIGKQLERTFAELIQAKDESYRAQAAAEKLTQVKSDFLARMSHEIRTPLNGILGISSLLKQTTLTNEQKKQITILHQGGEHLLAVLNDVLDFSQIEQDKLNINYEPFILNEVLETIKAMYSPLCKEKGITFIIDNQICHEKWINSDQVRITQILFNLLSNAVKFTQVGYVKLSLSLSEKGDESILCFNIEDTGLGIYVDEQARMFEPFIQAESTEIRSVGGSGLGLAIVKQLLELLHGNIHVESELGVGSLFKVEIPILSIKDNVIVENDKVNIESQLPINLNVLLIEDNKSNAYIAKAYCQKYNLKVEWEESAKAGIRKLQEQSFDLILMDNQMPEMSGIEATKYIRKELKLMIPIYAYTADVLKEASDEFLLAGADYIITKPIKEKSILDALVYYKSNNHSKILF